MRLVQEELAVAGRGFGILVDGDDDRLDVLITLAVDDHLGRMLKSLDLNPTISRPLCKKRQRRQAHRSW
jgi:hypothetical protein